MKTQLMISMFLTTVLSGLVFSGSAYAQQIKASDTKVTTDSSSKWKDPSTYFELKLGGYSAAGSGASSGAVVGLSAETPRYVTANTSTSDIPLMFRFAPALDAKLSIAGAASPGQENLSKIQSIKTALDIGMMGTVTGDKHLPIFIEMFGAKVQYNKDNRTGLIELGPEVTVGKFHFYVPVSSNDKNYICVDVPLPMLSAFQWGAAKIDGQSGYSPYMKVAGDVCGHLELGKKVGEFNFVVGAEYRALMTKEDISSSKVSAEANIKAIGGTPFGVGIIADHEVVSTPDGPKKIDEVQAAVTAAF